MNEDTRNRVLDSLAKSAIADALVEANPSGAFVSLESLADDLGVPPDCVGLHSSLAELTMSAVASVLTPGDVLALAEPCRESWLEGALACGGRFLDVGRDHALVPMENALLRALRDGVAQAVLIEHPAVFGGGTLDLPDEHDPFIFVDQSASVMPEVAVDSGVLHLGQTGGTAWVVGTPERLTKISQQSNLKGHPERELVDVETMARALEKSGLLFHQPGGAALWARRPGILGSELERAFIESGVDVRRRSHPSWREGIAMVPPEPSELDGWIESVQRAMGSFSDTE